MKGQDHNRLYRNLRHKDKVYKERAYRKKVMPYMSEIWYPLAVKDELQNAGYFLTSYPWRGVLHTTEGTSYAGARQAYVANRSAPHFTVSFENGVFKVRQHIPINRAARALRNASGGVETNRLRCIQIEIVGFAASSSSFGSAYLDGIGRLMRWIEANTEIKRVSPPQGFASAYGQSNLRFSGAAWLAFNGWCGHCHVSENTHWDPGLINIQYLLKVGIDEGVKPMFSPAECFAFIRTDPTNGGWIALKPDGAIFNGESSLFWGGVNGKPYWGTRQAAKIVFPQDNDPKFNPIYKYAIVSTAGEYYGMPE
jgi:hypothetical protein